MSRQSFVKRMTILRIVSSSDALMHKIVFFNTAMSTMSVTTESLGVKRRVPGAMAVDRGNAGAGERLDQGCLPCKRRGHLRMAVNRGNTGAGERLDQGCLPCKRRGRLRTKDFQRRAIQTAGAVVG